LSKWQCTFERAQFHLLEVMRRLQESNLWMQNARLDFEAQRGVVLFKLHNLTPTVAFRDLIAQTEKNCGEPLPF
jgi:hypothetical protein